MPHDHEMCGLYSKIHLLKISESGAIADTNLLNFLINCY